MNGRSGYEQNGVDIFCSRTEGWYGIQCKAKAPWAKLTEAEVRSEIQKARKFTPALSHLVIATSSHRNPDLQEAVRKASDALVAEGRFSVSIAFWEDIEDSLHRHPSVLHEYLHDIYGFGLEACPPTKALIEFWLRTAKPERLGNNVRFLPSVRFDLHLSAYFILDLQNLQANLPDYVDRIPLINPLVPAMQNFLLVVADVLDLTSEMDLDDEIVCYMVPEEQIPEDNRGWFIEYRKAVLRGVLWHLIPAGNAVIDAINRFTIGGVHPVLDTDGRMNPQTIVRYPDGRWGYPGLGVVEDFIRKQMAD